MPRSADPNRAEERTNDVAGPVLMTTSRQTRDDRQKRRPYVMAMVLGTALTALGGQAPAQSTDGAARTVEDLSRYCTTCWRNAHLHPDTWTDCTQEVLCRLLERITPEAWDRILGKDGEERREFFRAIDTVKKRTQRGRKWLPASVDIEDRRDRDRAAQAEDREALVRAAEDLLTPRQRQIVLLTLEGLPVQDIAARLHLPAERVSDEKYKAIRKLRARLGPVEDTPRPPRVGEPSHLSA